MNIPMTKPAAAGKKLSLPRCSLRSIAGIKRLHTDAATITPAAKPISIRSSFLFIVPRIKNTAAEPSAVPKTGRKTIFTISIEKPAFIFSIISISFFSLRVTK